MYLPSSITALLQPGSLRKFLRPPDTDGGLEVTSLYIAPSQAAADLFLHIARDSDSQESISPLFQEVPIEEKYETEDHCCCRVILGRITVSNPIFKPHYQVLLMSI